ncbi:MAG: amidase [Nocardioides sp.]|jgi:amidase
MAQLHDLTSLEQGTAIKDGEVSPIELVRHYAERADEVGAYVTRTTEQAVEHAQRLGSRPADAGPLWGVPTAIKDLNATRGVRTTFGSAIWRDFVPAYDDHVVTKIESAGLISLGKTNTPEFGSPCYTEPEVAPPAVTPWDRTRMAGGSSGGAAAAVAAGLAPIAQGSDGGGSIRIPASCCGIVGLKPSRGRVSSGPLFGEPVGLSTNGPLGRTVRDVAAFLDVMAGPVVGDPFWASPGDFLPACEREPGRLRIARFIEPVIADVEIHPEVVRAYDDTSVLLASLGHEVVDIEVPMSREAVPVFETCWSVLTALSVRPGDEEFVRPLTRWLAERGHRVSGPEFGLALGEMRRFAAGALQALAAYDAVLTPTIAQPPPRVGALRNDEDPEADFEAQKALTPWTSAWNVTGMPAISLPLHWTPDGLPVGVMLAARPAEEELLLALATQVEQAVGGFTGRTPPGW